MFLDIVTLWHLSLDQSLTELQSLFVEMDFKKPSMSKNRKWISIEWFVYFNVSIINNKNPQFLGQFLTGQLTQIKVIKMSKISTFLILIFAINLQAEIEPHSSKQNAAIQDYQFLGKNLIFIFFIKFSFKFSLLKFRNFSKILSKNLPGRWLDELILFL
jgi:hypothetical protein